VIKVVSSIYLFIYSAVRERKERERESEIKLGFLAVGGENAREEHLAFLFVCFFSFFFLFFFENVPSYSIEGEKKRES
jgi:hypothetical protein